MRHCLPEKWNEIRAIQILRSSDFNPTKRPLNELIVAPEQWTMLILTNSNARSIMISPVELVTRISTFTPHPRPPVLGC